MLAPLAHAPVGEHHHNRRPHGRRAFPELWPRNKLKLRLHTGPDGTSRCFSVADATTPNQSAVLPLCGGCFSEKRPAADATIPNQSAVLPLCGRLQDAWMHGSPLSPDHPVHPWKIVMLAVKMREPPEAAHPLEAPIPDKLKACEGSEESTQHNASRSIRQRRLREDAVNVTASMRKSRLSCVVHA